MDAAVYEIEDLLVEFYRDWDGSELKSLDKNLVALMGEACEELTEQDLDRCLYHCEIVLDEIWEGLNTGHWREVDVAWRKGYTIVSHIKAQAQLAAIKGCKENELKYFNCNVKMSRPEAIKCAIRTCDMGLLMGCPSPNDPLCRLATYLHTNFAQKFLCDLVDVSNEPPVKKLRISSTDFHHGIKEKIEILDQPSLNFFVKNFFDLKKPVIIQNCMEDWPAKHKWDINYLNKTAGWRVVPIELGSKYTDDTWSQKLMTVQDFIQKYLTGESKEIGYLAQHQLLDQIPELIDDIIVPDYCALSENGQVDTNAWFGPKNTISPLHRDEMNNIFCQVRGKKYFRLYDPIHTDKLCVHENHLLKTTSQIDVENPDFEKFPDFASVPYVEFSVSAGDMLFIPAMYWHYVRSESISFSVSFWFND